MTARRKSSVPARAGTSRRPRRHSISRNASKTKPAKLLAVFVVDTDETALTTPVK